MSNEIELGEPKVLVSNLPTFGGGGGKLDFDQPYLATAMRANRSKEVRPGLTIGQEIAENVDELLHLHEGQTLLDLGCGPGLISYYLTPKLGEKGWLYCLDASHCMIDEAKSVLFGKRATLIYGDIHVVDKLVPEKVDAAFLSGNVHLLTNRGLAFKAIWDSLKPNGQLVIVCHAYSARKGNETNSFASLIDGLREKRQPGLKVDGLRLPFLSLNEILDISNVLVQSGFSISFNEKDSSSSDLYAVLGFPPTLTIEKRLEAIDPRAPKSSVHNRACSILSEISRGTSAQLYLLCSKKEVPSRHKVPGSR